VIPQQHQQPEPDGPRPPRTGAIDALSHSERVAIHRIGSQILRGLTPSRRIIQAFHEFNEQNMAWLTERIRSKAAAHDVDLYASLDKLQDFEIWTVLIDEEEINP
jgi:hypothetical protein